MLVTLDNETKYARLVVVSAGFADARATINTWKAHAAYMKTEFSPVSIPGSERTM